MRLLLLLLLTSPIFAQTGVRYDNYNITSANNYPFGAQTPVFTMPNSTVTICSYPDDGGQPCGNVINVYSDPALTQVVQQPLVADTHGRFGFWLAPGTYTYSVVTAGGQFAGTYIFTLGGSGGGSGCNPSATANSVLYSPSGTNCSGDSRFVYLHPGSNNEVNINGGAFLEVDGVDNSNYTFLNGDQFILFNHGESNDQTGNAVHIDESAYVGAGHGPLAYDALFEVDKAGHSATGFLTEPSVGTVAANSVIGYHSGGPAISGGGSIGKFYSFLADEVGTNATTEEFGFYANTAQDDSIHSNYCDFMARTQQVSPVLHESLGCGASHASTFNGPVTATIYAETLTTPASSSAACTAGQFTDDANYHYVCVATNTWKRVALTSF